MRHIKNHKIIGGLTIICLLVIIVLLAWPATTKAPTADQSGPPPAPESAAQFNKNQYPTDAAASLWAVVNKGRALPSGYVPANLAVPDVSLRLSASSSEMQLRADAAAALEQMFAAAKAAGINLMLSSGYRSYSEQVGLYNSYAQTYGQSAADTFSARPGHSEHQTGLAADVEPSSRHCEVNQCFADTPEGQWLAANSYKYGFIIRYTKDNQNLTGYEYEPWHVRYIGTALAQQINHSGQTLEQFFSLPIYTTYPANSLVLKD